MGSFCLGNRAEPAEKAAVIVTTNLPFSEWTQVAPKSPAVQALLDRITDRAYIIETGFRALGVQPREMLTPGSARSRREFHLDRLSGRAGNPRSKSERQKRKSSSAINSSSQALIATG